MNGQPTVGHPIANNEQLPGKFHVEKVLNPEETLNLAPQQAVPVSSTGIGDESGSASRFQMIRVDRNFVRGRWKVNDYEPPENVSTSMNPPVNTIDIDPTYGSNASTYATVPSSSIAAISTAALAPQPVSLVHNFSNESNLTSSTTLPATAASAAVAATAFQQQQQRQTFNNPPAVVPTNTVANATGLLHPYTSAGPLPNMAATNQPFLLPNHQFAYYPFFAPPYASYHPQWATLAGAGTYLPHPQMAPPQQQQALPQTTSQLPTGNLGDPIRHPDAGSDMNSENPLMPPNALFSNATTEHLQNAQLAAAQYLFASHHTHPNYLPQTASATNSPYSTIPAYHPGPGPATILPAMQALSVTQPSTSNMNDIQLQTQTQNQIQSHTVTSQAQVPVMTSPKHESAPMKNMMAAGNLINNSAKQAPLSKTGVGAPNGTETDPTRPNTVYQNQMADLLSLSPSMINSQPSQSSLLSPITVSTNNTNIAGTNPTATYSSNNPTINKGQTGALADILGYTTTGSPISLTQTAAQTETVTAVAAISLLNNESGNKTEITNELLKGLGAPTKQNHTTDIDNKISAAMDLVKRHLLLAVSEEVTELRQQIRQLNEKVFSVEHENAYLRAHVSPDVYNQYTATLMTSAGPIESINPNNTIPPANSISTSAPILGSSSSATSSQSIPTIPLTTQTSSLPAASVSTTNTNTQHSFSVPVSTINQNQPSN